MRANILFKLMPSSLEGLVGNLAKSDLSKFIETKKIGGKIRADDEKRNLSI